MKICLFGASSPMIDAGYLNAVEELTEKMAQRGHTLVFGAGATGLMGAAARGMAKIPGRRIIGIAPKFFDQEGVLYKQCTELIYTETMRERKALMEEMAEAFIMVPGGVGTLEEFFEVITLNQLGQMKKPIAVYDIKGYFHELEQLLHKLTQNGFAKDSLHTLYALYESPEELLIGLEEKVSREE